MNQPKSFALVAIVLIGVLVSFCDSTAQSPVATPRATVEILTKTDAAHVGEGFQAAARVTIAPGFHVNANKPLEDFLIPTALTFEPTQGISIIDIQYPEPHVLKLAFSEQPVAVYEGQILIAISLLPDASMAPGDYEIKGVLKYQACDDKQCFAPAKAEVKIPIRVVGADVPLNLQHEDVFKSLAPSGDHMAPTSAPTATASSTVAPSQSAKPSVLSLLDEFKICGTGGFMNSDEFLAFLDSTAKGQGAQSTGMFEGKSPIIIAILTLLGGLALNLTPCVLPLIPINLAIIGAGVRARSRSRGFGLGAAYGVGIAAAYGVLGSIVVLTTAAFGAVNASPWFNIAITLLFIVLGLAMFDLIQIDFSRFQSAVGLKKKEGGSFLIAFAMGVVSALLAGACVAPVVIAVIVYARDLYAAGNKAGLVLPFLLGAGMALPWPVAGAGLSMLPKPGKWMSYVKYAFGVFILVLAAYYGHLSYGLVNEKYFVDRQQVAASAEVFSGTGWTASLEEGLRKAKDEGKPVLIDFWATWCKNCLVMNKTTLQDPRVISRLDAFIKVKYQSEQPDNSPHKEILSRFEDYVGFPFFVVLLPR